MTPEAEQWAHATRNNIDPKVVSRLPRIPKAVKFSNAKLIGSGVHSEVYSVSTTYKKRTVIAALKIFSERWKEKFEKEVRSYEFLEHFSVWGVVPVAYGCDKDWKSERLHEVLGDALAPTSSLRSPVSVIMLEYIADSAPLSTDNVNWTICKETLRGLDLIHSAQVLHHDIGERNLLIVPSTRRVVWIDFSSSYINPDDMEIWQERGVVHSMLYQEVLRERLEDESKEPLTPRTPPEFEEDSDSDVIKSLDVVALQEGQPDQEGPNSTSAQLPPNRKKYEKRARTRPFRLERGLARFRSRSTNAEHRTNYIPLRREAEKRKTELTSQGLKLTKSYEEYGSTDGDWRLVPTKGRVVLPPGCAPRRSRRLNG